MFAQASARRPLLLVRIQLQSDGRFRGHSYIGSSPLTFSAQLEAQVTSVLTVCNILFYNIYLILFNYIVLHGLVISELFFFQIMRSHLILFIQFQVMDIIKLLANN